MRASSAAAGALALAAALATPGSAGRGPSKADEFLREDDFTSSAIPPKVQAPPSRSWDDVITLALRAGKPDQLPEPCDRLLGLPSAGPAKVLRFLSRAKGAEVRRELFLYFDVEPTSGEARPRALALVRRSVLPKGRTEWEERVCQRLSLDGRLERSSLAWGRILMAEDKLLDPDSSRAKKLRAEEERFFLRSSLGLKPAP